MTFVSRTAPLPLLPEVEEGATAVVAQLGQSLDGRIATVTGMSKYINGERALDHLHALRAAVDAVIVGVGTVVADDPQLTVRRAEGENPVRVIIDPTGRLPAHARCLRDGAAPVLAVCRPGVTAPAGAQAVHVAPRPCGGFAPADVVAALAARGLRRILVEGGADTLARFLDARAVDMLHVLMAPMILGSGKSGFSLAPIEGLEDALRPCTRVHVFDDGDVLFACDMRNSWRR